MTTFHDDNTNSYYEDPSATISPTSMLFPPDLSMPNGHLTIPPSAFAHRQSISAASDQSMYPYLSGADSLSPSSSAVPPLQYGSTSNHSTSPRSSGSPSSNFSLSANDEFLLANSFSQQEIDMLLYQSNDIFQLGTQTQNTKPGSSLFFPNNNNNNNNNYAMQQTYGEDETLDLLNLVNASPVAERRQSVVSEGVSQPDFHSSAFPTQLQQRQQPIQAASAPSWSMQSGGWSNGKPLQSIFPPANNFQFDSAEITGPQVPLRRPAPNKQPVAARRAPPAARPLPPSEAPAAPVGKHNKTERRYRQKVQLAQADLRDSVPALRVLYGTSTEEQKRTTDFRAADGTVDGLGEITRPNASAKTTIFAGARLYIELLQRRNASLSRKVRELEEWRLAVAGEDDLKAWQADFEAREKLIAVETSTRLDDSDGDDDEEEEEEEQPKRKRAKAPPKKRGENVRTFAAFAMTFSLVPSASTVFRSAAPAVVEEHGWESATTGQVLARLPIITAEHTARLLARGLPVAVAPTAQGLVEWTWRILIAVLFAILAGPVLGHLFRSQAKLGRVDEMAKDLVSTAEIDKDVERVAAAVVGGAYAPSALERLHLLLHLKRRAASAYPLALRALLQPELPMFASSTRLWQKARMLLPSDASPALASVLGLPIEEARSSLAHLPPTASPLAAIAEQVALTHLNALYSKLFIKLVDASTSTGSSPPPSVKTLLANLEKQSVGERLKAETFDAEMRQVIEGVPKGSAAHALGLVLVGLWGVFTGPTPEAQAALASALAGEELKGAGSALASVPAMLELLYPGFSVSSPTPLVKLPDNAIVIDKLALVCIRYIRLLASSARLNEEKANRLARLEASRHVQKATESLRLALSETNFRGLNERDQEGLGFKDARERLVGVLSLVGRRAAARARARDEDSGFEGEVDEL